MSMDMSHGGMDHGSMDHSGTQHSSSTCKMNMVLNWDPTDVCVVFEWWHIRGPGTLAASLICIILLGIGYEYLRTITSVPVIPHTDIDDCDSDGSSTPTLIDVEMPPPIAVPSDTTKYGTLSNVRKTTFLKRYGMRLRSVLYAIQVMYSFFIMLIAMTYNGWIIIAVGVGALIGHLFFGYRTQSRTMSCH
ncbi:Ctr copper transporter family-domain-containing protein [Lipomyces kononenkoae]|uniref:Ctr copper transporter family-domain-containing protein n=1 Tax=Lipomyces kononenkoae TaxID=34357 RepID=A0ACC3SV83_LIPKO